MGGLFTEDRSLFVNDESRRKQATWETAVTVIGALLSAVIVFGTIVFICRRQITRRCLCAKLTQTPAHEALLGRGTAEPTNRTATIPETVLPLEENGSTTEKWVKSSQRPCSQAEAKSRSSVSSGFMSGSMTNSAHEQTSSVEALFPAGHRTETSDARAASQESKTASKSSRRGHRKSRNFDGQENHPLDVYPKSIASTKGVSCPHETRPPVEGRDAPSLQKTSLDDLSRVDSPTAPRIQVVHKSKSSPPGTPDVLSRILRRGGNTKFQELELDCLSSTLKIKNPEERDVLEATSPQSDASSLILPQKDPANQDADFITNDEFEYDDYIPELPGSYLTMDQPGYTLTWSKQHL